MTTQNYTPLNIITTSDTIFITIWKGAQSITKICRTGFSTISEIIAAANATISNLQGRACLTIRNQTQGWSKTITIGTTISIAALHSIN